MTTPGPKPKPVEQALRDGTAPNRIPNPPLRSGADAHLEIPEDFNRDQTKAWNDLIKLLTELDVLDTADTVAVETAATVLGRLREARRELNRGEKIEVTQRGASVPSPWWRIEKEATMQISRLLAELGLSPSARARLANTGTKSRKPDETLDDFLGPSGRLQALQGGRS